VDRQDSLKERKARMILDARRSVLFSLGDQGLTLRADA
jgi:hypothetical protein